MSRDNTTRRKWLKGALVGLVGSVAGCSGESGGNEEYGPVVEFELTAGASDTDPNTYNAVELYAEVLQEDLGVKITREHLPFAQQVQKTFLERDFDIWHIGYGATDWRLEPHFWTYQQFHSSQRSPGQYNFHGFTDERMDELTEEQMRTIDYESRKETVDEIQQYAAELSAWTPLTTGYGPELYNTDRVDMSTVPDTVGQVMDNINTMLQIQPSDGNTLLYGATSSVPAVHPFEMGQGVQPQMMIQRIYDTLVQREPKGDPKPWAAESVENVDETTWEVTLRDDLVFHDGEPLTVEDVKFSFEYQGMDHTGTIQASFINRLESVEILDDSTVQFNLSEAFAPFLANGLGFTPILPKHIWEGVEKPHEFEPDLIGSGPFKFESWERDERLVLSSFDDHFSPPNIDEFIRVAGTAKSTANSFETGDLHVAPGITQPNTVERLAELENSELIVAKHHGFSDLLFYNHTRDPMGIQAFRNALIRAIPKQELVNKVYNGHNQAATSVINHNNARWHNPDVDQVTQDIEAAKQLLEDEGFAWDNNGNLRYPPDYTPNRGETETGTE